MSEGRHRRGRTRKVGKTDKKNPKKFAARRKERKGKMPREQSSPKKEVSRYEKSKREMSKDGQ